MGERESERERERVRERECEKESGRERERESGRGRERERLLLQTHTNIAHWTQRRGSQQIQIILYARKMRLQYVLYYEFYCHC